MRSRNLFGGGAGGIGRGAFAGFAPAGGGAAALRAAAQLPAAAPEAGCCAAT